MLREQFEGIARTLPFTLIVIGGGGGALIALANLIRLAQALRQGEPAGDLYGRCCRWRSARCWPPTSAIWPRSSGRSAATGVECA